MKCLNASFIVKQHATWDKIPCWASSLIPHKPLFATVSLSCYLYPQILTLLQHLIKAALRNNFHGWSSVTECHHKLISAIKESTVVVEISLQLAVSLCQLKKDFFENTHWTDQSEQCKSWSLFLTLERFLGATYEVLRSSVLPTV